MKPCVKWLRSEIHAAKEALEKAEEDLKLELVPKTPGMGKTALWKSAQVRVEMKQRFF